MSVQVPVAGIILAAGLGTRMKSALPKGLHQVCGFPMVEHIGRALRASGVRLPVVVVGHGAELIREKLGDSYAYAIQHEQLGTGHAALMAAEHLATHKGPVIVAPGDTPLLTGEALKQLLDAHLRQGALVTVATFKVSHPGGYGRLLRDPNGKPARIIEAKDATEEELKINEVNSSVYCFDCETLFRLLPRVDRSNAQKEMYLTDLVGMIHAESGRVAAVCFDDETLFMGVNDRWQLAEAGQAMRLRILKAHAMAGVTIVDPATTFIGPDVVLAPDVTVEPMSVLDGSTKIGGACRVGPMARINDSELGEGCNVIMSNLNGAKLGEGVKVGPFAHLRPGAVLGNRTRIGNFVEVKNAELGEAVAAGHLAYLGDATIGSRTNVGAGTITCNFDGLAKHRTTVGEDVFIGSNSTLVAPVSLGDRAFVAAGSVITEEVPAEALALGRARQVSKEGWVRRWREKNEKPGK